VKKRVRKAKGKDRTLIERLIKLKDSVCLFIKDFAVQFDNNQAERDLRNVKTKSKVSGCFQSNEGAQVYLTVMSFLSTASKYGVDAYEALKLAFAGKGKTILGIGGRLNSYKYFRN
jgi:transposase